MSDPITYMPKLLGVTLDATGVAKTQVVALNRTTGDTLISDTNASKVVVFDAANFTSGYSVADVIDFQNVGGSVGNGTITINATGEFQDTTLTCAAAATVAINL